jgi:hypothetical protein
MPDGAGLAHCGHAPSPALLAAMVPARSLREFVSHYFGPDGSPDYVRLVADGMTLCPYWQPEGYEATQEALCISIEGDVASFDFSDGSEHNVKPNGLASNDNPFHPAAIGLIGSVNATWLCSRSPLEIELVFVGGPLRYEYQARLAADLNRFRNGVFANTKHYVATASAELGRIIRLSERSIATA